MQFSPVASAMIESQQHAGVLGSATHIGVGGIPGDGPYVRLYLEISQGCIHKATYECNGCPSSVAAGNMAAHLLTGRSVEKALLITPRDILLVLGGLPEGKEYYAELAAQAIQSAIGVKS